MVPYDGILETAVLWLGYAPLDVVQISSRLLLVDWLMLFCHSSVYDERRLASVLVGFDRGFVVFAVTLPLLFHGLLGCLSPYFRSSTL